MAVPLGSGGLDVGALFGRAFQATLLARHPVAAKVGAMPRTPRPTEARPDGSYRRRPENENDSLASWVDVQRPRTRARTQHDEAASGSPGLRFAFYGRISTEDFQDEASSRAWQRQTAAELIAGHGQIVTEYFDAGLSRRTAWADRPRAAALLATLGDPGRGIDAIVVGEYERAFCGNQLVELADQFNRHGVQLWLPETDGPFDHRSAVHQALVMLLGAHSKREVQRSRFRTLAAMQAQVREQGRYLGGRPPYGYRLVDAGPHPNAAHARWGRRLRRLDPDPATAPHIQWIYAQRLAGHSMAGIARNLNERAIPCPAKVDPERNRHRTGESWTLRTVAAILANPRYTGRQVWNRQHTGTDQDSPRWVPKTDWVISNQLAHPPLVSEDDFIAAQAIRTTPTPTDGSRRAFLLAGLLRCRACGRRLESHWVHGRSGYRCRHGHTSAKPFLADRPKTIYLREDDLLATLRTHIGRMAGTAEPCKLAAYLRANEATITCGASAWDVVITNESL